MTDDAALHLLELLSDYREEYYGEEPDREQDMTVQGLGLDLIESMDRPGRGVPAIQRFATAWGVEV